MSISVCQYTESMVNAVAAFNERLRAGGVASQFPTSPTPKWLPKLDGRRLFQEYYLAIDDQAIVHGGYILKHQDFWVKDEVVSIGDFHLPVSEGAVNKKYPHVGVQLLRDALQRQPLLYGLGIGGVDEPLTKLLKAAGWQMFFVPFFFRIIRPTSFLRNIAHLRRSALRRLVLDSLAFSGLGWLGINAVQAVCAPRQRHVSDVQFELVDEFADWADDIWAACRCDYGMTAVRDAETLRILYPKDQSRFLRLRFTDNSRPIGWVVALCTPLSHHKHFGNMRLGSIVDGLARVADVAKVVRAAAAFLQSQGADLIVSNQSHSAWCHGLGRAGFCRGPSNFIFASSPKLTELLCQKQLKNDDLHFNRGDGDGPIHL